MPCQLGIDTGGTFTDAVIIDSDQQVLATFKSLTTAHDLAVGIGHAVAALPSELLAQVDLVSLSTTLSTNSVVEGRGAPVAILLPGYTDQQVKRSGLGNILEPEHISVLAGGHDATGKEAEPLDLDVIADIVRQQQDRVSAFAVSAMFGTRNTAHEQAIRQLIIELTGKPVACGHELASSLGAPRRALTAALNARMILYIKTLIDSVESILQARSIDAPLMIVKGDGSLINAKSALQQPVATVLSGPAASVVGACALSGQGDALVVDMGGTTTDIAVVTGGSADLCEDGARIGDWQPMVRAIRVFSTGLGGDSEVRFDGRITISQRRVVPVSLLVHQHPELLANLRKQWQAAPNARHNRFAMRLQNNEVLIRQLAKAELQAWESLADGPVDIDEITNADRSLARAIARLERLGLVIYSGFTPSDATHVLGLSDHWNCEAASLAARLWARQMRHVYGCGTWTAGDAEAPSRQVFDLVVRQISLCLIEAGLNQHSLLDEARSRNLTALLTDIVLDATDENHSGDESDDQPNDGADNQSGDQSDGWQGKRPDSQSGDRQHAGPAASVFDFGFNTKYPIVAVGGPAAIFFPAVAKRLGVALHLPPHGQTANAIGAVMGSVVQHASVTVTQPEFGIYVVFHDDEPQRFNDLDLALDLARTLAQETARHLAVMAGAEHIVTRLREAAEHVKNDIDGELFVSATITAIASGRPVRAAG